MEQKLERLRKRLAECGSLAIAFSGGVDSAFLLKTAHEVLGGRMLAVTVQSRIFPMRELEEARQFCIRNGIRQIACSVDELDIPGFSQNPKDRCYLCKRKMMQTVLHIAKEQGMAYTAEGSNTDDEDDYRPGHRAVAELGVLSPLRDAGLTKMQIRELSRQMNLPTWDKPSFACLASRFVYGEEITPEKLSMVDRAEQLLLDLGFSQVRVRIHGWMARIEVLEEEFGRMLQDDVRKRILTGVRECGFTYVSLDLQGYRTGSMNEALASNDIV